MIEILVYVGVVIVIGFSWVYYYRFVKDCYRRDQAVRDEIKNQTKQ